MTSTVSQILLIIKRVVIVIGIASAFSLGLLGAIYLSLRSSETRVPDVVGKDRTSTDRQEPNQQREQFSEHPYESKPSSAQEAGRRAGNKAS